MQTVNHYCVVLVPRQNRAEIPILPEDKGVLSFLTEKVYLRKYFKVFCVEYRLDYAALTQLVQLSFTNGIFIEDVSRDVLSDLGIEPLPYNEFLEYCYSSMLRSHMDSGETNISTARLTAIYYAYELDDFHPEEYHDALFNMLCCCSCFGTFFAYEGATFAAPNGVAIINPIEFGEEYNIPPECVVSKEYDFNPEEHKNDVYVTHHELHNRYVFDCRANSVLTSQDTVVCHEDDIPDDDDFNAAYAEYKELV